MGTKPCVKCEWCGGYSESPCYQAIEAEDCSEKRFKEAERKLYEGTTFNFDATSPKHYARCEIEPIDFIQANNLDYCTGNVIKYVIRHAHKNGLEDLRKARKYLEFIAKRDYGEEL